MDAPSISVTAPASVNPITSPEGTFGSAPPAMRGAEFANLLGHLMNPGGRQDLAAAGLQALPIGPQIEVITAAEPLPDAASLAAFAKGQGLDEAMVSALLGGALTDAQIGGGTVTAVVTPGLGSAMSAATPANLADPGPELLGAEAALPGESALLVSAAMALSTGLRPVTGLISSPEPEMPPPPTSGDAIEQQAVAVAVALAAGGALPALVGRASSPVTGRVDAGAPSLAAPVGLSPPPGLEGGRLSSLNISQLNWQVQAPAAAQPASPVHELLSQATATDSSEVLPEALRLRLTPNEFITQRLAAMSGTGEQATWGAVAGQSVAAGVLRLDMRGLQLVDPTKPVVDQPPVEMESAEEGLPAQVGTHPLHESGRPGSQAAASTATPWTSTAAQRAEQYEQLAQRLGEALGQRLQNQLERGHWKLQMRLDPAQLGRIDLDLDMSAGGLDAVFRSDNQVTRDLIAQSLGRLRESLSQSGTAVANVWVQGDSSRQSGGNPTPGRAPDQQDGRTSGRDVGSEDSLATSAVPRPRQGTSAWDVLA